MRSQSESINRKSHVSRPATIDIPDGTYTFEEPVESCFAMLGQPSRADASLNAKTPNYYWFDAQARSDESHPKRAAALQGGARTRPGVLSGPHLLSGGSGLSRARRMLYSDTLNKFYERLLNLRISNLSISLHQSDCASRVQKLDRSGCYRLRPFVEEI